MIQSRSSRGREEDTKVTCKHFKRVLEHHTGQSCAHTRVLACIASTQGTQEISQKFYRESHTFPPRPPCPDGLRRVFLLTPLLLGSDPRSKSLPPDELPSSGPRPPSYSFKCVSSISCSPRNMRSSSSLCAPSVAKENAKFYKSEGIRTVVGFEAAGLAAVHQAYS